MHVSGSFIFLLFTILDSPLKSTSLILNGIRLKAPARVNRINMSKRNNIERKRQLAIFSINDKVRDHDINRSYVALGALLFTFASNQWSRQAIYYLCNFSKDSSSFLHINVDLNFSQEAYASLASLGFTLVFAICSLFAGSIADNYPRNLVTAIACTIWSIATAVQGFTTSYFDLVPLRSLIGASQGIFFYFSLIPAQLIELNFLP